MKYTAIAFFFFVLHSSGYSQPESIIYNTVICEYVLKEHNKGSNSSSTTLLVLESPKYMKQPRSVDFDHFIKEYKKLEKETFNNFLVKNVTNINLKNEDFSRENMVTISHNQSTHRKDLLVKYPNWNTWILEFSKVGFNQDMNQALLYYGFDGGPGIGGGIYIILKKKRNKWKIVETVPAWAS